MATLLSQILLQQFRQRHVKLAVVKDRGNWDSEAGDDQRVEFALLQFLSQLVDAVSQTVLFDGRLVAIDDPILRDAVVGIVVRRCLAFAGECMTVSPPMNSALTLGVNSRRKCARRTRSRSNVSLIARATRGKSGRANNDCSVSGIIGQMSFLRSSNSIRTRRMSHVRTRFPCHP